MGNQTLAPHLVESLKESTKEILETMVFLSPLSIEQVAAEGSDFSDEVIGLLGFTGTRCGTFVVRTHAALARLIAAKMLMLDDGGESLDFAEAADAFGEVVNMLSGNFKNTWVAEGNQMDLSVPNVIHNGHVRVNSDMHGSLRTGVCVALEGGQLHIGIHFDP